MFCYRLLYAGSKEQHMYDTASCKEGITQWVVEGRTTVMRKAAPGSKRRRGEGGEGLGDDNGQRLVAAAKRRRHGKDDEGLEGIPGEEDEEGDDIVWDKQWELPPSRPRDVAAINRVATASRAASNDVSGSFLADFIVTDDKMWVTDRDDVAAATATAAAATAAGDTATVSGSSGGYGGGDRWPGQGFLRMVSDHGEDVLSEDKSLRLTNKERIAAAEDEIKGRAFEDLSDAADQRIWRKKNGLTKRDKLNCELLAAADAVKAGAAAGAAAAANACAAGSQDINMLQLQYQRATGVEVSCEDPTELRRMLSDAQATAEAATYAAVAGDGAPARDHDFNPASAALAALAEGEGKWLDDIVQLVSAALVPPHSNTTQGLSKATVSAMRSVASLAATDGVHRRVFADLRFRASIDALLGLADVGENNTVRGAAKKAMKEMNKAKAAAAAAGAAGEDVGAAGPSGAGDVDMSVPSVVTRSGTRGGAAVGSGRNEVVEGVGRQVPDHMDTGGGGGGSGSGAHIKDTPSGVRGAEGSVFRDAAPGAGTQGGLAPETITTEGGGANGAHDGDCDEDDDDDHKVIQQNDGTTDTRDDDDEIIDLTKGD